MGVALVSALPVPTSGLVLIQLISGSNLPFGVRVRGSFCECGASKFIHHLIWVCKF